MRVPLLPLAVPAVTAEVAYIAVVVVSNIDGRNCRKNACNSTIK